jgi:hypothetical protein
MVKIFPTNYTEKTTIAANDMILFSDSEDSDKLKKAKYSNLKWEKWDTGATWPTGATGATWPAWPTGATGATWPAWADGISCNWKGDWLTGTVYALQDIVYNGGSSYVCEEAHTSGTFATDLAAGKRWIAAQKGADGTWSGDISWSWVANELAYFTAEKTIDNLPVATYPSLTELSYVKWVTSAIQTQINGKQATGSYEVTTNKETSALDTSTTKYPCNNVVKSAVDLKAPLASPTFTGTVTLPTIQLWEASMKLDAALSADGKWSGITETGTAWAALAFGELCYFQASDSRWELVDANLSAWYDKKLWMCVLAANADWDATEMLLIGKIRADAKFPTMTIGSPVYMGETAGTVVVTQPSTADVAIRVVWYANTADELWFNPSSDYIVHT